jgi:beta-glucosidase
MTRNIRAIAAGAAAVAVLCATACTKPVTSEDPAKLPFRNPALSFAERARDLVARMTLDEMAHQLGHTAPAIPRLGIPEYNWWNEGLHGVARAADLVVFVAGLSARIEGEEMKVMADGFSGGDRTSLDLPGPQQQLLERVQATGKPVVLVVMNGSALAVNWADQHVPAIIEAWYPGEEGGTAVAGLIAGDFSPAGRLPVTFYKSVDQLPPFTEYAMAGRTYRYFTGEALYPFGFGLSYTSFHYDNLLLDKPSVAAADTLKVSVDVSNTGQAASDEVAQVYLSHPGVDGAPLRALAGFQRLHLAPGEKKTVSFELGGRDLSTVDSAGMRRITAGKVDLWVGGGQPVVARAGLAKPAGVAAQFTITNSADVPK